MDRRLFAKSILALVLDAGTNARLGIRHSSFGVAVFDQEFDVRDFGAVGNGFTDDTRAFERALAAAASKGGRVRVPAGVFAVNRILNVRDGVALEGVGRSSVLQRSGGNDPVIACQDSHHAAVLSVRIKGTFSLGITIDRSSSILVRNCFISGGILPSALGHCGGIFSCGSSGLRLEANELSGNGQIANGVLSSDIQINGVGRALASSDICIIDNKCRSTATQYCIATFDINRSEIRRNVCSGAKTGSKNNNGYGILIYQRAESPGSCFENTVAANRVSSTGGSAIYLQTSNHSRVVDNLVDNACDAQEDHTLPVAGVALNQSQYVVIADNRITRVGRAGISIASNRKDVGHVEVTHNTIAHTGGMGIHLRGILTGIRVLRNTVTDTNGGIGGYTDDPQDQIVIVDNEVSATTASSPGIILANASRSTVKNNRVTDSGGYGLALSLRDEQSDVADNIVVRSGRAFGGKYPDMRISRSKEPVVSHDF